LSLTALSQDFDPVALWDRLGRDSDLLGELIEMFETEGPLMMNQIERAISDGRPELLQKASHKLKGSLLQFSATGAADTAQSLELMGKSGSITDAGATADKLQREVATLMNSLRRMQRQRGPVSGPAPDAR
jgi:HPt (histidine-containing phosphotransfer) domain-containing protein